MRDEIVIHYHRPVAKRGETQGRDVELDMAPLHTEEPYIQQIIPASGYLAVYSEHEDPWIRTVPVIAWGVVLHYENETHGATEYRDVQALVLEDNRLVPFDRVDVVEIVREGDEKRIEELRGQARQKAEGKKQA